MRARGGPLYPPIDNLPVTLEQLALISAELAPRLRGEAERIVVDLGAERDEERTPVEVAEPSGAST